MTWVPISLEKPPICEYVVFYKPSVDQDTYYENYDFFIGFYNDKIPRHT